MKTLSIELENCYGIKKLKHKFDFSKGSAFAIYAPNGMMKSSLAQTFMDIAEGTPSTDRVFPARVCTRVIKDETGTDLSKEAVVVVRPYDKELGHTEKTSTLLVNSKLRQEYETLHLDIHKAKENFLKAMKVQSGSKKDLEREISTAFTKTDQGFYRALVRIKDEVQSEKESPFADVPYDMIFDEKVLDFLGTKDFKTAIADYVRKYNELLAASTYFKRSFNYYNAETIAKNLADNGFFDAKHTVTLNGNEKIEIATVKQLEELIAKEKEAISNDPDLRKKYADLAKLLYKNAKLRELSAYLEEHEELLPELSNIDVFKEELWKSYFRIHIDLYMDLVTKYQAAEKRKKEIEDEAAAERTQWHNVINIFNRRFIVPFKLEARNHISVVLGQDPMLSLGFVFEDNAGSASIEKSALMQVLSTGEQKALYILNIIFEVEARKKAKQSTVFVVDDIADSFDYKNKYAIIEYLKEMSEEPLFNLIILTHNFDFFRTIESRKVVQYINCLMALKGTNGLTLERAEGIKNVFVNDWRPKFFKERRKKIASIPFMRNIIEYTKGDKDPQFTKLTSLLHWKADSATITHNDLDGIYNFLFNGTETSQDGTTAVVDCILNEANNCLNAGEGINFENKVVLSIAIRLVAEKFMVKKIDDSAFVTSIEAHQTAMLFGRFKSKFDKETASIEILQRVILMTPESIHLNSFMYEPILDMSDVHLRQLYKDVLSLT